MTQKYKIKHIRFKISTTNSPVRNNTIIQLYRYISQDYSCYRIVNEFFFTHRTNSDTRRQISSRLDSLKREQGLHGFNVNQTVFNSLKSLILNLFENPRVSHHSYQAVFTGYFEYLVIRWKKIPGRDGKVAFEPLVKYKRKELFRGELFANTKCDVVYKNTRTKTLSFYECKFGIRNFLSDLQTDVTLPSVSSRVRRAHKKIDYLKQCERLFSKSPLSDVENNEAMILTLASHATVDSYLGYFRGIKIMAREDIEDLNFYNQLM